MGRSVDKVKKEIVLKRYYAEDASILKISREEGISRNTIKKYIAAAKSENLSFALQNGSPESLPKESVVKGGHIFTEASFPRLASEYTFICNEVDNFQERNPVISSAVAMANELGLNSSIDISRFEDGMIHYLSYLTHTHRINCLLTTKLDHCWILNTDKMTRSVSRLSEIAAKSFKAHADILKELEIRYNKRYPDLDHLKRVTILNNQINVGHASC